MCRQKHDVGQQEIIKKRILGSAQKKITAGATQRISPVQSSF